VTPVHDTARRCESSRTTVDPRPYQHRQSADIDVLVSPVVREPTAAANERRTIAITMARESSDTERYAEFLDDAPRWLHYEQARIDELDRSEVNQLARLELGRRDHAGPIQDDPLRVSAWLFVSYTLDASRQPSDRGGDSHV